MPPAAEPLSDANGASTPPPPPSRRPRLFIKEMVLWNFKSYAREQRIGPFHKEFSPKLIGDACIDVLIEGLKDGNGGDEPHKDPRWVPSQLLALDAVKATDLAHSNAPCRNIWTEYHEMGRGEIKTVVDYNVYTAYSILDLLHFVAPKTIQHGGVH